MINIHEVDRAKDIHELDREDNKRPSFNAFRFASVVFSYVGFLFEPRFDAVKVEES